MDERQLWELLERGGGIRRGHFAEPAGHSEMQPGKYSGFLDPKGADELGRMLAERFQASGATVVMVWDDVEDLLLGFVVARELGCKLVRVYNDGGLLGHSPDILPGDRAVLIADRPAETGILRAARALLENLHGSLLGTGVLVATGQSEGQDTVSLVRFDTRIRAPADCPLCHQGVPVEGPATVQSHENVDARS